MARDYAARNRKPAPKPAGLPGWVWLTAGLSMGLVVAALVYIGRPTQPMPLSTPPPQVAAKPRPKIEIPPREEPRFDFYTQLQREQVVVPREDKPKKDSARPASPASAAVTAAPSPAPAGPVVAVAPAAPEDAQYLIVLGSFREETNAHAHRAKLAFAGAEAQVEGFKAGNGETLYRVRVGPEKGLSKAQAVLAELKSSGFDGRVVKVN